MNTININDQLEDAKLGDAKSEDAKSDSSWYDEFIEFWNELLDLLYIDYQNSLTFISQNKKYVIWSILAAVLLQFTNITNLGRDFEKYCGSKGNKVQKGGAGNAAGGESAGGQGAGSDDGEFKANQQRINFFQNLKQRFSAGGDIGGKYGVAGPVFGNLGPIFDTVKYVFYILFVILAIAGVLSLPILIYLVITYFIIKHLVAKFVGL